MSGYSQLKKLFLDISGKQKKGYLSYSYNIAIKIINKAIAVLNNSRRQLEKFHVNALTEFYFEKNSYFRPISPRLIIEYRSCVWESLGSKNFLEFISTYFWCGGAAAAGALLFAYFFVLLL